MTVYNTDQKGSGKGCFHSALSAGVGGSACEGEGQVKSMQNPNGGLTAHAPTSRRPQIPASEAAKYLHASHRTPHCQKCPVPARPGLSPFTRLPPSPLLKGQRCLKGRAAGWDAGNLAASLDSATALLLWPWSSLFLCASVYSSCSLARQCLFRSVFLSHPGRALRSFQECRGGLRNVSPVRRAGIIHQDKPRDFRSGA